MDLEVAGDSEQINLLKETEKILSAHGFNLRNIRYIVNSEGLIPVASFVTQAHNFYYYNNIEHIDVDTSLKICGRSWWLERIINNGTECWCFMQKPQKPTLNAVDFVLKNTRNKMTFREERNGC